MQPKNRAKCCKNTAVISRRVRLELTTFDFNGLEYCFILNRSPRSSFKEDFNMIRDVLAMRDQFFTITQVFYNK